MSELYAKLKAGMESLPKKQRLLCSYIFHNIAQASALTIAELAESAGVGTTTVTRTLAPLGYTSYMEFRNDLKELSQQQSLTYNRYLIAQFEKHAQEENTIQNELFEIGNLLVQMGTEEYAESVHEAVRQILNSKRIFVMGARTSASYSLHLTRYLELLDLKAFNLSVRIDLLYDYLSDIKQDDCVIVIMSFPGAEISKNVAEICCERKIPLILIADQKSKQPTFSDAVFIDIKADNIHSSVCIMACLDMIFIELTKNLPESAQNYLRKVDDFVKCYGP